MRSENDINQRITQLKKSKSNGVPIHEWQMILLYQSLSETEDQIHRILLDLVKIKDYTACREILWILDDPINQ